MTEDAHGSGDAEVLGRFAAGGERAVRIVQRWQAAGAEPQARVGEWSAADVVRHLIAVEWHVVNARLDSLDAGPEPAWSWAEPGPAEDIGDGSLAAAAVVFAASREATVDRIRAFTPDDWRRAGIHATYGRLDVAGLLELMIEHDDHHLDALEALGAS